MESLVYGGHRLWTHFSLLFTFFARHCYLPTAFMECEFIPLVKDKGGDITLVSNYKAIAISNVETKLLESIMLNKVRVHNDFDKYQYGFKKGHSTGLCTYIVKRTIEYYVDRGSHVFATFIDFTKAFDRVNYWILFNQLLDDGVDLKSVHLLVYWYTDQQARSC